jgi:site-specific recombinase XerD
MLFFSAGKAGKEKGMIDSLFTQASTLTRLQLGPLAARLPFIAKVLQQEQYRPESIRRYLRVADRLGRWLRKRGLAVAKTDEAVLARYRASIGRRPKGQLRAAGRGLSKLLMLLRMQHAVEGPVPSTPSKGDAVVAAFDAALDRVAGLMPGTRHHYVWHAKLFVAAVFGTAPFDVAKITPQAITDFVRQQAGKLKPARCAALATSLRSFLRFLIRCYGLRPGVIGAVPTIRQWKLASLPKHLSVEEVERTLGTCNEQSPVGRRDRAILLLLLRLALRAGEVARLRLTDVDWREGSVRVHSPKSCRERRLPLPEDVGQALAAYLRDGRPQSAQSYIFLRTRAPFSPIAGGTAVTNLAKRHLQLAGISVRGLSAHAFRHTAATQMVRRGASFKQVADVLGHRLLETTNIYAKLDEDTLHRVALPWPGGRP